MSVPKCEKCGGAKDLWRTTFVAGSTGGQVSLPPGLSIDTSKLGAGDAKKQTEWRCPTCEPVELSQKAEHVPTLDEWVEGRAQTRRLKQDLQANIDVFCDGFPPDEQRALLRMNLIMVRQCLKDLGVE